MKKKGKQVKEYLLCISVARDGKEGKRLSQKRGLGNSAGERKGFERGTRK